MRNFPLQLNSPIVFAGSDTQNFVKDTMYETHSMGCTFIVVTVFSSLHDVFFKKIKCLDSKRNHLIVSLKHLVHWLICNDKYIFFKWRQTINSHSSRLSKIKLQIVHQFSFHKSTINLVIKSPWAWNPLLFHWKDVVEPRLICLKFSLERPPLRVRR